MIPVQLGQIKHISCHHMEVQNGGAYVAIRGSIHNGEAYIAEAISRGAAIIVLHGNKEKVEERDGVLFYHTPNVRLALSQLAAQAYPGQPQYVLAVTGTSGKTSVVEYCRQITAQIGYRSASLGSLGVNADIPELSGLETLTTPDPISLHRMLQQMSEYNISHLAMEASSHGLEQHRLDSVKLSAAGFTNLTHEHLDYHNTMDMYFAAKARLFNELLVQPAYAVLNTDATCYQRLRDICHTRGIGIITYGRNQSDIKMLQLNDAFLKLEIFGAPFDIPIKLGAEFQAYNIMCAVGLVLSVEGEKALSNIISTIPQLTAARGRLELAATYNGAQVYVDHAHKPDSLDKVLTALRAKCRGRLLVVFGCGGDRDKEKRPLMGSIAAKQADIIIVTDDNPRTEEAAAIRKQILIGCPGGQEIESRSAAIDFAMQQLQSNDILLIAGKGHEEYQIIGATKHPYSDFAVVQRYLSIHGGK